MGSRESQSYREREREIGGFKVGLRSNARTVFPQVTPALASRSARWSSRVPVVAVNKSMLQALREVVPHRSGQQHHAAQCVTGDTLCAAGEATVEREGRKSSRSQQQRPTADLRNAPEATRETPHTQVTGPRRGRPDRSPRPPPPSREA
eukprot:353987-Chlamydomonas_euryale.AAC.6